MSEYQRQNPGRVYDPIDMDPMDVGAEGSGTREKTADEIERDIRQTREQMSENIDALGEKLSPRRLKAQAREAISDAAHDAAAKVGDKARGAGHRAADVVRGNVVPFTMIGAGIAWLVLNRSNEDEAAARRRYVDSGPERRVSPYDYGTAEPYGSAEPYVSAEAYGSMEGGDMSGRPSATGSKGARIRGSMHDAADKIKEKTGSLKEKTGQLANRAGEFGTDAKSRARDVGARAHGTFDRTLDENPLALAAGAAALGLVFGMLLPASERENRMMGPTRDRLVDTAKETAREVKDVTTETVRSEASERGSAIKESARELAREVKESAGRVAEEAKGAAKETAKASMQSSRRPKV